MTRGAELLFTCTLIFSMASPGWADYDNEVLVSTEDEVAVTPDLFIDVTDNVVIAWAEDSDIVFAVGPHFDSDPTLVTEDDLTQTSPAVHVSSIGTVTFVYSEADVGVIDERELVYRQSVLGIFQDAAPLTDTDDDDAAADIAVHTGTELHVGWVVDDGTTHDVWVSSELDEGESIAEGSDPRLVRDSDGNVHLVYERDGDLFYRLDEGDGFGDEVQITDDLADDLSPSVVSDLDGVPAVAWVRGGDIYYTEGDGLGGFDEEVQVTFTDDDCSNPLLVRNPEGAVSHVLYIEGGDIYQSTIVSTTFITSPLQVTDTDEPESSLVAAIDSLGHVHVAYLREGELHYKNDAPVPDPAIELSVESGPAPLRVDFTYVGTGPVEQYRWDFGDGGTAIGDSPTHTFEEIGVHDVTVSVTGPGGRVEEVFEGVIEVTPSPNVMWVPNVTLIEGQEGAVVPVLGSHDEVIQGYQVAGAYDGTVLDVLDLRIDATAVRKMFPEFLAVNIIPDDEDSYFTLGLIIDSLPPFDGRELDAAESQRLINIELDVLSDLEPPIETTVDLRQDLSTPVIFNVYTVGGESRTPELVDGTIEIIAEDADYPSAVMIRGDNNNDGTANFLDVLDFLEWVFIDADQPECVDAADSNDDGILTLSDALLTLEFLFQNGPVIMYPYPAEGFDPTNDDDLDCDE